MVSLKFNNVYIKDWFTIAGPEESKSNIKNFNYYLTDNYYGEKTYEAAEIKIQKTIIDNLNQKHEFDLIIGGDLSNQLGTMNASVKDYNKSFIGAYSACATFVSSMILASSLLTNRAISSALVLTSSHKCTSERQFRFPNEYNSMKAASSTITATGGAGAILSNDETNIKVVSATIGSVVDYGIKDVSNMGAVMAPSAAAVITNHLYNMKKTMDDYDVILTGDLGVIGVELLKRVLEKDHGIITEKIIDSGSIMYKKNQKKFMGGSGPVCLPIVFFNSILHSKRYKRILLIGTGSLHNPTLINQQNTIPSISHAIEIEVR